MSGPKRKREVQLNFRVSPEELALIEQKMAQLGTKNREAYLRKMALDGYVVRLELPELKELVSLMRRSSNNLNQLTRRVHETGRIYDADLEDISQRQEPGRYIPAAGGFVGWGASGIDPAGEAVVTGAYAPAVREARRVRAAAPGLPLFSLPVSLHFCGPQAIISSETR